MELSVVEYEKKGTIAHVRLNRPDKLNVMNAAMHEEIGLIWEDFRDDDELRVAILSGNWRCFSVGADLSGRCCLGSPSAPPGQRRLPGCGSRRQPFTANASVRGDQLLSDSPPPSGLPSQQCVGCLRRRGPGPEGGGG